MSIKVVTNGRVSSQVRKFPCLRKDENGNILLFKDNRVATIIYSPREENIGMQYTSGEYNPDNLEIYKDALTLQNVDQIDLDN